MIADQVMGYVLCFARNLHTYVRRQIEHRYEPAGARRAGSTSPRGREWSTPWTGRRSTCRDATMGVIGMGGIGARSRGGRRPSA